MARQEPLQSTAGGLSFSVLVFTYLASLVFYDYEILVNPRLADYGDALWWAWMNVTTVGAAIFPVTAVGKVVCVLLPIVGMIFFPIFTVYISQYYTGKRAAIDKSREKRYLCRVTATLP